MQKFYIWNLFSISWKILWWLVFQLYLKEPRWPIHIVIFFICFPGTLSQGLCSLWKKCGMEEAWSLNENCYYSSLFYHIMEFIFLLYVTGKPETFPKQLFRMILLFHISCLREIHYCKFCNGWGLSLATEANHV